MLMGVGAAALALGIGAGTAHATTPTWRVTQTTKKPGDDGIADVTVAPTGSSWAVGGQTVKGKRRPLVQHLSGATWKDVTLPASWSMPLDVIDASSSKNVWAFGATGWAVHWNGKKWTSAKFTGGFHAADADVISASDVWAVNGATARHWNGKKWTSVKLPAKVGAVHAVSAKDVWAAGSIGDKGAIIHWNGKSWKVVQTIRVLPKPEGDAATSFTDVTVSGKNVWAVGAQSWTCGVDGDEICYRPLALRLTGTKSKSFIGQKSWTYDKVAPDGSGGVWILQNTWAPTLIHVTGDTFTSSTLPTLAGRDIHLGTLANRPGTKTVWAAGSASPQGDPPDPTSDGVYLRTG
jgi:hypothetical protein